MLFLQDFDLISHVTVRPGAGLPREQTGTDKQAKGKTRGLHGVSPDWQLPAGYALARG
ncbi:Uncharacterized protein PPKH_3686 [Pseudomonas putida]|nr:Uncharacterized protein PPKH_3686 [Pseudomonas putida]